MNSTEKRFGIATTISLVIGIVIGSGIFFKADDILIYSGGNTYIGVLAFLFIGTGVIFGALLVSNYAIESDNEGGIIAYSQMVLGHRYGFSVGWFLVTIHFPAMIALLSWVTADFTLIFLGIDDGIWILTVFFYTLTLLTNYFSTNFSGLISKISTVLKLIPLIIIAIVGLFLAPSQTTQVSQSSETLQLDLFPLLIAIAFSFDGWIIATSISGEVKNVQKNLPRALVLGTTIIMIVYILYFVGMTRLIGVDSIIASGDAHVAQASQIIFNNDKIITLFVMISVYGGLNGMMLAYFRLPHALVQNKMMKDRFNLKEISQKRGVSLNSVLFGIPFVCFFLLIHALSLQTDSSGHPTNIISSMGIQIDSLPVIVNYVFYCILFLGIIPRIKRNKLSRRTYIYLFLALVVNLTVIFGSFTENGLIYIGFSSIVIAIGQYFYQPKTPLNN